jgi:hypothetical protein
MATPFVDLFEEFLIREVDSAKILSYKVDFRYNLLSSLLYGGREMYRDIIYSVGQKSYMNYKGLIGLSVNQYLVYDANTDRLGIGTEQPNATLSIVDQNIELVFGASEPNIGSIGTFNSADLELVTDNTARLTIGAGGDITLGNANFGPTKVKIVGSLGVNVSSIDPRTDLHVSGAIKFNNTLHLSGVEAPTSGAFNEGDILWNNNPQPGRFIGWVCTRAGNPGLWSGFGRIE